MLLILIETNFVMTVSTPISLSRCRPMCKLAKLERHSLVTDRADASDANALVRKNTDAFIGQISPANNKKQHFKRKHKHMMHKFQQNYFFLVMSTKHILKFTSERFVFQKTCPKTITLTFPPLIYTVMFQNLLSSIIKNEIHLRFCLRFRKRIH